MSVLQATVDYLRRSDNPKAEYRSLARALHPDLGGSTEAMATLTQAWDEYQRHPVEVVPTVEHGAFTWSPPTYTTVTLSGWHTQTGYSIHADKDCMSLRRSKNIWHCPMSYPARYLGTWQDPRCGMCW